MINSVTIQFVGHDKFLMDLCSHYLANNSALNVLDCITPNELSTIKRKKIDILFVDLPADSHMIYQYGLQIKRLLPNCRTYALGHRSDISKLLQLQHIDRLFYEIIPRTSSRQVLDQLKDKLTLDFSLRKSEIKFINFTRREKQIISLTYQEFSNNDIAKQLSISLRTVETHKSNIYIKLGTNKPSKIIKYAASYGLT